MCTYDGNVPFMHIQTLMTLYHTPDDRHCIIHPMTDTVSYTPHVPLMHMTGPGESSENHRGIFPRALSACNSIIGAIMGLRAIGRHASVAFVLPILPDLLTVVDSTFAADARRMRCAFV
eukprot:GHVO01005465.1.p2 GENE.GHVO01005465.1~~GHVO01005465.1.p2  ORF type:complete len:119 (-),score=23.02 GHVO01005465.1:153-509(-)